MTKAVCRRFLSGARLGLAAFSLCDVALGLLGCSQQQPDPGSVRFLVRTTPAPDDVVLSPLRDARVTALELRDARTDDLLARSRFDPPADNGMGATM